MEPHSVWQGSYSLFGVDVKCHVLSNGKRIIEEDSMVALFEAMEEPQGDISDGGKELTEEFCKWLKRQG